MILPSDKLFCDKEENNIIKKYIRGFDRDKYNVWIRAILLELDLNKIIDQYSTEKLSEDLKNSNRSAKGV